MSWLVFFSAVVCVLLAPPTIKAQALSLDIEPTTAAVTGEGASGPALRARELVQRGRAALAEGSLYRANRAYRQALDLDPSLHAARHGYARSLLATGRESRAVSILREGLALEPGHTQTAVQLAALAAAAGAPGIAIEAIRSVPRGAFDMLDDQEREGWLAALYLADGRAAEAMTRYVALSELEPESLRWLAGVALSAEALGQRAEASAAWHRIVLLGEVPSVYRTYAAERVRRLGSGSAPTDVESNS